MSQRVPPAPAAVSPGVWCSALPFPNPLGFAFSYSVRVPGGVVVVDMGWDSDESWEAFVGGLKRAGAGLDDLVGVVSPTFTTITTAWPSESARTPPPGSRYTPPNSRRSRPAPATAWSRSSE